MGSLKGVGSLKIYILPPPLVRRIKKEMRKTRDQEHQVQIEAEEKRSEVQVSCRDDNLEEGG